MKVFMLILLVAHLVVSTLMLLSKKMDWAKNATNFLQSPFLGLPAGSIPWAISVLVCLILFLLVIFVVQ